jgi:hypothetical protein
VLWTQEKGNFESMIVSQRIKVLETQALGFGFINVDSNPLHLLHF